MTTRHHQSGPGATSGRRGQGIGGSPSPARREDAVAPAAPAQGVAPHCLTCKCPRPGDKDLEHSALCVQNHQEWWRVWERDQAGEVVTSAIACAANAAAKSSKTCPACKAGKPPPPRGT